MKQFELILVIVGGLLLLSVLASRLSSRLGVPALLLFLLIGMLAGSEGPGGIYFDDARLAQSLGVVALSFILFDGGLGTDWSVVRSTAWTGISLSTIGVLVTAILVGLAAMPVLGFSLLQGLLLGAVVAPTDAAAVFSVLREKRLPLKGRVVPLLELESGLNDPMAVFLTIGLTELLTTPGLSPFTLVPFFVQQMLIGGVVGIVLGFGLLVLIARLRFGSREIHPILSSALVMATYGGTALLGGSGFLAVYLAGLVLGGSNLPRKDALLRFHNVIALLMEIAMFLALGLLVFPSHLLSIIGVGLLMTLVLLVARPVSVFVSLPVSRFSVRQKTFIAWVGLRGAAPIILATFPLLAGVPGASLIFDLVFFIVLVSVLAQGLSIPVVARWLGLVSSAPTPPAAPVPPAEPKGPIEAPAAG
jgi:potassium/hydrogen antiporter